MDSMNHELYGYTLVYSLLLLSVPLNEKTGRLFSRKQQMMHWQLRSHISINGYDNAFGSFSRILITITEVNILLTILSLQCRGSPTWGTPTITERPRVCLFFVFWGAWRNVKMLTLN